MPACPPGLYIALMGPIGVGKSTLADAIVQQAGAALVPERFGENRFLTQERFYADGGMRRWALATELEFLCQRADDLAGIEELRAGGRLIVSDFTLAQCWVFAQATLDGDEAALYTKLYERVIRSAPEPDLVVCLDAELPTILGRIRGRGRSMEKNIDPTYMATLQAGYRAWAAAADVPVLRLDTTYLQIPTSEAAREVALRQIWTALGHNPGGVNAAVVPRRVAASDR